VSLEITQPALPEQESRASLSFWQGWIRLARAKPLGAVGLCLVSVQILAAVLAPLVSPYDPYEQYYGQVLEPPSHQHLFGTDNFGRDLFSRVIWGAQISIKVGLLAVGIGVLLGSALGLASGYFGGTLDLVLQRVMDAWIAFPSIILALAILAALGAGEINVMIAIGLSLVPFANRIVRGSVLAEKTNVYVEAARSMGCSELRIMARHILPNVTAPIIVIATMTIGQAILAEAALSFLGVGVQPPHPAWGSMLSGHSRTYMLAAPWMAIFPGLAIFLAVMGWNLVGDALRDLGDPRLRRSMP
jgi:peptide/nickel transport system permease protein